MQEALIQLLQAYPLAAPITFIIIRSSAVIFPPIPGILLDAVGIVFFGWKLGFIYAEIGVVGGALLSFWLARQFREPLVRRFLTLQKLHRWEDTLSENRKFWALVGLRIITGPLLFDYINYVAGLTKIRPIKFFLATIIGTLPVMLPIYFFGDFLLEKNIYLVLALVISVLLIAWLQQKWYKRHYLKSDDQQSEPNQVD